MGLIRGDALLDLPSGSFFPAHLPVHLVANGPSGRRESRSSFHSPRTRRFFVVTHARRFAAQEKCQASAIGMTFAWNRCHMPLELTWQQIALRLFLTFVAGAVIGLNREEHGQAAGLRTTLLVCFAASIAMLLANLLLDTTGKASDSFVVLDLMRLPLGILSGMGFIGAGVILRKDNAIRGVTTAATLWFVTVMGLCFGGGQVGLGLGSLALGMIVLRCLKPLERRCKQHYRATLRMIAGEIPASETEIARALTGAGYQIVSASITIGDQSQELTYELSWLARPDNVPQFGFLKDFKTSFGLAKVDWRTTV